ncbi:MAG: hypothetical protein ABL998_19735 [Planctomycetota bacterium]
MSVVVQVITFAMARLVEGHDRASPGAELLGARRAVLVQVRLGASAKHHLRGLRARFGLARRFRPAQGRAELAAELAAAGLELVELAPLSRLFSDKALLLARPARRTP